MENKHSEILENLYLKTGMVKYRSLFSPHWHCCLYPFKIPEYPLLDDLNQLDTWLISFWLKLK